jgi:hypothetical protein
MGIRLIPGVQHVENGQDVLLFNECDGRFYALNATAAAVLGQLLDGTGIGHVADELARRHGISPGRARHDVTALVAQLAANRLIQESP